MTQPRQEQLSILRAYWSRTTYAATGGTSSTNIAAATLNAASVTGTNGGNASTTPPIRGIITLGASNLVRVRENSDGYAVDNNGIIFGRLTFAAGNYTISYVSLSGGVEVSRTLPGVGAINLDLLFPEVMEFGEVPANAYVIDEGGFVLAGSGGGAGGSQTLAQTLAIGNTTGGNDINMSTGDAIIGQSSVDIFGSTPTTTSDGGDITASAGDGGSVSGDGGSIVLSAGNQTGGGNGGNVLLFAGEGVVDGYVSVWAGGNPLIESNKDFNILYRGLVTKVVTVTSGTYTIQFNDYNIFVNNAGAVTVTLPTSPVIGLTYIIKDISGNAITNNIVISGPDNIDGLGSFTINANYQSVNLVFNGTEWSAV